MENVHSGHRERMRQKFLEHGLDSFTDVEAVELLLTFALPRRETNTLAHALLERFHGLRGLLEAEVAELRAVPGVGDNAAALITLMRAMNQRYAQTELSRGAVLDNSETMGRFLLPQFLYCREEKAVLVTLDSASRVIRCHTLARGASDQVMLSSRDIVILATQDGAAKVVLAHNHGSGVALPSHSDVVTTAQLRSALQLIGVQLSDHLVISENDWVSMRDSGWLDGKGPADEP